MTWLPLQIPDPIKLGERIGHMINMYFEPCLVSPLVWIHYSGPLLNKVMWTYLPIDWKHAYKAATGESWVKTARGVVAGAFQDAPAAADAAGAVLDLAATIDSAAWWFWVGNGWAQGLFNWMSFLHKAQICTGNHDAGYALQPGWGFADEAGQWQRPLWDAITNPNGFWGIANGTMDQNWQMTMVGAHMSFLTLSGSPWQYPRLHIYPVQTMAGPHSIIRPTATLRAGMVMPIARAHAGTPFDMRTHSLMLRHEFTAMDFGDPPPIPPDDCTFPPPSDGEFWPRCFQIATDQTPSNTTAPTDRVHWGHPPPLWQSHPAFAGISWEYQVNNGGGLAVGVNGAMQWAFKRRGT